MNSSLFTIKIYTPSGLALEDQASSVQVPTSEGEIGVLPEHAKYIGMLGTGIMQYQTSPDSDPKKLIINSGFCTVEGQEIEILTDRVDTEESIEFDNYKDDLEEVSEILGSVYVESLDWKIAKQKLERINAIEQLRGDMKSSTRH